MSGVFGWFEGRGEIPLRSPYRVREYAPVADDPNRPVDKNFADTIRGVAFAIEYCDSHGWMSTRTIRCLAIDPHRPAAIRAFCHVRGSVMTFRVDRIISIIDLHSGRVVSSEEHLALLGRYLSAAEQGPSSSALAAVQEATRHGVFALLQVAMADGSLSEEARAVVGEYAKAEAKTVGCPLLRPTLVDLWIGNLSPPLDSVTAAVSRLLGDRDKIARVLPYLLKVARCRNDPEAENSIRELMTAIRLHFRDSPPRDFPRDLRATR